MEKIRLWQGVRMRTVGAPPDPDAPPRAVTIPFAWDDAAAASLAALVPGTGPASLERAADLWIRPIGERARQFGIAGPVGDALHRLLLTRRGAPTISVWRNDVGSPPGFVLNAAAFLQDGMFDADGFGDAVETAAVALTMGSPGAGRLRIGFADLAGLLAGLGFDYDSEAARDVARCLAAILRGRSEAVSGRLAGFSPARSAPRATWAAPPSANGVPRLAEVAGAAHRAAQGFASLRHIATTAILPPGQAEAILGVETGGFAPPFAPFNAEGGLARWAKALMAARGQSIESALAASLAGGDPFPPPPPAAHRSMHEAVAPFIQAMPTRPAPHLFAVAPKTKPGRELPARRPGYDAPLLPLDLPTHADSPRVRRRALRVASSKGGYS